MAPLEPFKNKVFKLRQQGPGKRSLPGRTRPWQEELVGKANQGISRNLPRRATRPGKAWRGTSFRARQDNGRGKALAAAGGHSVPALQRIHQRVALRGFSGTHGGRLCSQGCAVACNADKIAIVAGGGTLNGPFLHCLGDANGHLLPLSPAVRVR